jgi:hypothetical protein
MMSNIFFEIMNLQPNENEFRDAVRDSNSNETAYQIGFMHGRSYAAQLADNHRDVNLHDELVEALTLLLHEVAESGNYCANDFGWPEAIIKSEKALAKADGER